MFDNEAIVKFIRNHEEPCVTASDIAEYFGKTNNAVHYRLGQLMDADRVREKEVGASAKVYYLLG